MTRTFRAQAPPFRAGLARFCRTRTPQLRCPSDNQAGTMYDLAAGPAERRNACGGDVRPGVTLADPGEAGTRRGAA